MRLISLTKIRVVDTGLVLNQRPDPTSKQTLVQTFIPVVTSQPHILQDPLHASLEYFPLTQVQPGPPEASQDEGPV